MQKDLDHTDAFIAVGFDVVDIIHQRRKLPFVQGENVVLNFGRWHAVVGPHNAEPPEH